MLVNCIICEEAFEGYGNNPAPLYSLEEGVPARIEMLYNG